MGILYKTRFYLAGPIQFTVDGESWRDSVEKTLGSRGINVFNPYRKPFVDPKYLEGKADQIQMKEWVKEGKLDLIADKMRCIRSSDLALSEKSDAGIFYFNPKIFTIGTTEELTNMNRAKRPCFVLWDSDEPCFWLMGMLKLKYIYRTWDSLLQTIADIDDGKIEPDSRRWKLLREEFR